MELETKDVSLETTNNGGQSDKEFNRNKWLFCTSGIGRDMLYTLVSTYFLQYVQFGLSLTVAQFATLSLMIGILGRIWDGINDPMMGAIIDGSHFKWGKFKPWIFWGAILDSILTVALFTVRPSGWLYVFAICGLYILWEACFTMNDIGFWSMIPSLSRTKERRDKMTSLTIFFSGLGTIIMTALVTYLSPGNLLQSYTVFSIIAAVSVVGCQTITAFGVKEAPQEEKEKEEGVSFKRMVKTIAKNKQLLWMSLSHLFYSASQSIFMGLIYNFYYLECGYNGNIFYFVVIYAVCNTLLQLVYPKIAAKLGRQKTETISFIMTLVGFLGLLLAGWFKFFPLNLFTLCGFAVLVFAGETWFYTASLINMSNCVEYNDYLYGERNESVVSTMRPLIVKFADALKYGIVTLTLVVSGVYVISSHVSSLESQVSIFKNKVNTVEEVKEYVNGVNEVIQLKEGGAATIDLENKIATLDVLTTCQVEADFIDTIGGMVLVKYNGDKTESNLVDYKQIRDCDGSFVEEGYTYALELSYKEYNAADEQYDKHNTFSTRLIIRLATTVLPCALLFASWIIQKKKFIIDEEYFDMMLKEIEARKQQEVVQE